MSGRRATISSTLGDNPSPTLGTAAAAGGGQNDATTAPTWSYLYATYLGSNTIGHCGNCHSWATSASSTYSELKAANQISGSSSRLVLQGVSILKWFGGGMPQDTGQITDAQAVADFQAWVAAGALDN